MRFLAVIFFACALQGICADNISDAIQKGIGKIAQLKSFWQSEVPEIESIIFPEIDASAAEFAEIVAHVAKQVKSDDAKLKAVDNVKAAYGEFNVASKKAVSQIANARPDVLEKGFRGSQLANAGYEKVTKMVNDLKQSAAGNACKEGVAAKFADVGVYVINEVSQCVYEGGSNFPVPPNHVLNVRDNARSVTKNSINVYNRCTEEVGTTCFDDLVKTINQETQNALKSGESYVNAPHSELDMQRTVSNFCIKRKSGVLSRQVASFKAQMDKCQ